jgi:hypothetical protein
MGLSIPRVGSSDLCCLIRRAHSVRGPIPSPKRLYQTLSVSHLQESGVGLWAVRGGQTGISSDLEAASAFASSLRELIPSFWKTLCRWYSTVRGLR